MKNKLRSIQNLLYKIKIDEQFMFYLYCIFLFLSQFSYVLSFNVFGKTVTPVKIVALAMFLIDFIYHKKLEKPKGRNIWLLMMFIWNIWTIISIIWAKSKIDTLFVEVIFFEAFLFIYYGKRLVKSKKQYMQVLNVLFFALFIHNILCWLEVKCGIYLFSIYENRYLAKGYPVSTFTNTNNLACYLSVMFFLLIIAYQFAKNKKQKIYYISLMISSILICIMTNSRATIIALMLGIAIFIIMNIQKAIFYKIVGFVSASILVIFSLFYVFNPYVKKTVDQKKNDLFSIDLNAKSGSDYYRMNAYRNGIDFFLKSYGVGIGPGNVEYWMENYATRDTNGIKPLHNWWLEILVTSGIGIMGLMIYTWIVYYIQLIKSFLNQKLKKRVRIQLVAVIALGVVYAIACISPSSLYKVEWPWAILSIFFLLKNWIKDEYML